MNATDPPATQTYCVKTRELRTTAEPPLKYRTASGSDRMPESTNVDPKTLKQSEQFTA